MHGDIPRVLSGAVVTARTKETLRSTRYKHTRVQHDNQKMVKTQDSPSFDSLAIATIEIREVESKRNKHQTSNRLNQHLSRSMEIENKRRERRTESALLRPTRHGSDEGWKEGDMIL
jgi:hypothetical protein